MESHCRRGAALSAAGDIMDALAADAAAAVSSLTAANCERGLRLAADLEAEDMPHLFLHNPDESVDLLDHLQERVTTTVSLTLVTRDETQEATLAHLDLIRAQIRADVTLGGAVTYAYVSSLGVRESPEERDKAGDLVVLAVSEP